MNHGKSGEPALDNQQLFQALFFHMTEGVALHRVLCDEAGRPVNYVILDVNPQYKHFTGLDRDQVVDKTATEAYGTPEAPFLAEFSAVAFSGTSRHLETYFPPLDRHYDISVAPMGTGYFATIFTDITERIQQEKALRTKTEELDRFFSLSLDLLCIATMEGRFLKLNAAWEKVLGWSREELEGHLFLELVHPEDLQATLDSISRLQSGQDVIDFTNRYRCKDGSYRWIEWASVPQAPDLIYAAARDVTQRMNYERALEQSEEKFRRTFDLIPNPVTLSSQQGMILACNDAFCEAVGYSREELVGHTTLELGLWVDGGQRLAMITALQAEGRLDGMEISIRRRSGQHRLMLFSARILNLGEQPTMLAVAQDITEQRNLERQVLHSQKLESLGVLAGGIAHDFNNLLTGILGNADLARAEMSPMAPARRSLEGIEKAARRAADLCRQLLAYSGKGRFMVQPVDLMELVEEMGHLLSVSISKKVVLKYHFASGLPMVDADATQIRQVVMNLIVNASEAIGDRSGVISLTTGLAHCDSNYLKACYTAEGIQPGDFVYLEVADTGHGMDKATLDRIFDPFFTTKFTGRGLGLAAVLGIMRGHKGAIKVYSEPKRGTTFKLLFPPGNPSSQKPEEKQGEQPVWRGTGTILVVDDEETVRTLARRALEWAGFKVLVAEDGREALTEFQKAGREIVLVILDLTMPHLDGEACFRELRQIDPAVNVILSSGYNEQDVVNRFAGKGLAGFIQKPYTSNDLIAKVRQALGA